MTAQQMIDDAGYLNGKSSVDTTLSTRALRFLQNMLMSWSSQGLIVPYSVTENFTPTIVGRQFIQSELQQTALTLLQPQADQ